ncbi:MAG: folate-binding protein YgfZ, partial [Rhodospirillaceae bacterium]|nr:folate-binding protein YgfZ [Rhodospirillaceae bacterium]
AQGKYLFDFFIAEIAEDGGALVLDCEGERHLEFFKKLSMYKLKANVEVSDETDNLSVFAVFGDGALSALGLAGGAGSSAPFAGGVAFVDPRLEKAGARIIAENKLAEDALDNANIKKTDINNYNHLRISLGLPDGSRDMTVDRALLLENGFEELGGVSFEKGCYIGQEVTARTKYRGLVKKRLFPVSIEGPAPEPGTAITSGERDVGEMKSSVGDIGLALIKVENISDTDKLMAGGASIKPTVPDWMIIGKPE